MKKLKYLLAMMLAVILVFSFSGCYVVSAQKMSNLKGTYKLTYYTRTPKYERREGYVPTTYNYIEDEKYLYEDYLVVTGTGTGYYVHKEAGEEAYSKEVTLSYEYDKEETSKVSYVIYNDALTVNSNSGINRLGVSKNRLNYSLMAIDYTELITKRKMRSEAITVRWEKVSSSTTLSHAEKELGKFKQYDYNSFAVKGIYEFNTSIEIETGNYLELDYQYYFYVIDTAKDLATVTEYYALKETPTVQVKNTYVLSESQDWSSLTINGTVWTVDEMWKNYYYSQDGGVKNQISRVSQDITQESLEWLVQNRMPIE